MPLEKELETFEAMKPELLKTHKDKFALFHGSEFVGAYDSAENAYTAGVEKFGKSSFLVRKVSDEPEVYRNQALFLGLINARI